MTRIVPATPRLDVRDLEVILAVASAGSTVRAASSLHLTQSAVSRALVLAEEKLGQRIFDRSARGLVPTMAGKRLIEGGGPLLAQLVELERHARERADQPVRVRLACECYTAYRWLPSTVARLEQSLPSVEITLSIEHTAAPVPALLSGALDVALLTTSAVRGAIEERPLFSDEIVFVMAKSHPLSARPHLTLRQLGVHTLITSSQTPKPETLWFMNAAFGRTRPKLRTLRLPLTEAIIDAARAGMGIAILSEWIAGPYLESSDLVLKRLQGKRIERPWRLAFRRESEDAAKRLMSALRPAAPRLYSA